MSRNASGHEKVSALIEGDGLIPPPAPEHHDKTIALKPGEYTARWEIIVGGKGMRAEIGEPLLAIQYGDTYQFLSGNDHEAIPFTDNGWRQFSQQQRQQLTSMNQLARRSSESNNYWRERHRYAQKVSQSRPNIQTPSPTEGYPANNEVDHFINKQLSEQGVQPAKIDE